MWCDPRRAVLFFAASVFAWAPFAPVAAGPAAWRTVHDPRGFSMSFPPDWTADPKFADLNYPDNNGERTRIEGLSVASATALQPGTTLQGNSVSVAVEVLPPYRAGCTAENFLADTPPDYASGIDANQPAFSHQVSDDPGGWYSNEDFVYRIATKPCLAVHYFLSYATPGGEAAKGVPPFDRAKLLALLDRIRATIVVDRR